MSDETNDPESQYEKGTSFADVTLNVSHSADTADVSTSDIASKRPGGRYFELDVDAKCDFCGRIGHDIGYCPARGKSCQRCFYCGSFEHDQRFCPFVSCFCCGQQRCKCRARYRTRTSNQPFFLPDAFTNMFVNECYRCGGQHSALVCPLFGPQLTLRCKFCGLEHLSDRCPELQRRGGPVFKASWSIYCVNCGRRGHYHHECTKRRHRLSSGYHMSLNDIRCLLAAYGDSGAIPSSSPRHSKAQTLAQWQISQESQPKREYKFSTMPLTIKVSTPSSKESSMNPFNKRSSNAKSDQLRPGLDKEFFEGGKITKGRFNIELPAAKRNGNADTRRYKK